MEIQETRRHILEILREQGDCTVGQLVDAIKERQQRNITSVTVRHHLERLREEHLVSEPQVKRRHTPGRPQYTYSLTDQAYEFFPNNYAGFGGHLLKEIKNRLPPKEVNVILEHMAQDMAQEADIPTDGSLKDRVKHVVNHMNTQGYNAEWQHTDEGYVITTTNCPYERLAGSHEEVCHFDLRLMSAMLGVVPRMVGTMPDGEQACQYLIPHNTD